MYENDPLVLVVSDVHLGAIKSDLVSFVNFLEDINNGEFGNQLKALLILGDFFDLITDIPETLLEDGTIQRIFRLLIEIKRKLAVIIALGNHEVPITGNIITGTYDQKFKGRKDKFLNKFKDGKFNKLFDETSFCQYIVLKKWKNKDMLLLYDSRDQIFNEPISKIKINGLDLDSSYICLMMHGYQFENNLVRFFIGPYWKSLINSDNIILKQIYDYFWNEIIKSKKEIGPITIRIMKDYLINRKMISTDVINSQFSKLKFIDFELLKLQMRILNLWQSSRTPEYYLDGIKDFLEDEDHDFSMVNYIVYGHSHDMDIRDAIINDRLVEIINVGAWQHVKPSYAGIFHKGKIDVKNMPELIAPQI
ncbi:MAG: metallophosphoesterase [Promethearchaeota archaeon]